MGKESSFQQMVLGPLGIRSLNLTAYTKINSKWMKKKTCVNLCDHGIGNSFINMTKTITKGKVEK